jgi:hypothetical protein
LGEHGSGIIVANYSLFVLNIFMSPCKIDYFEDSAAVSTEAEH